MLLAKHNSDRWQCVEGFFVTESLCLFRLHEKWLAGTRDSAAPMVICDKVERPFPMFPLSLGLGLGFDLSETLLVHTLRCYSKPRLTLLLAH